MPELSKVPVIGGAGSNSLLAESYAESSREGIGVDGLLLTTPYYNKKYQQWYLPALPLCTRPR